MAQPAPTPFAVDSDITPLQGRYFESVAQNVSDPKLRTQLYDKVRATFGGIQQARDIQRAKAQEEEERTLSLELRRAQLDSSRMELGLARDKVRQQQEATAKSQEFNMALEDFQNYELPGLGTEEAKNRLNLLGAQYSDVVAFDPAAKAKMDLFNNAFESTRRGAGMSSALVKNLGTRSGPDAEKIYPGITSTPEWQVANQIHNERQDIASIAEQADAVKTVTDTAGKALKAAVEDVDAPAWSTINASLVELDKLGLINDDQKVKLRSYGINPLPDPGEKQKPSNPTPKSKSNYNEGLEYLQEIMAQTGISAATKKAQALTRLQVGAPASATEPEPSVGTLGNDG
jgi:hypothetical protein